MAGTPQPILPGTPTSTLMESSRLLPLIAGFVISAALLWLGSGVFALARARSLRANRRLALVALVIGGCGLWWPGHFLQPGEASAVLGGIPLVAATLALALAGLAGTTALVATRKTVPAFAGLSLLTLAFAYAHSLFATPGSVCTARIGSSASVDFRFFRSALPRVCSVGTPVSVRV